MKVRECMTLNVRAVHPEESLSSAAAKLGSARADQLPVTEGGYLVGSISCQDIVSNGVGAGRRPTSTVGEVMSRETPHCFEDDEVKDVIAGGTEGHLRHLPVLDRDERVVGVVTLEKRQAPTDAFGDILSTIA
jgi:CBS domain-containing protein